MTVQRIDVGSEELIGEIGRMTPEQLDDLPFGAIQLDHHGRVLSYNRAEERLSGRRREAVVGRDFFAEVAPCTRVKRFFGAFQLGVERRSLNEVFDFVFHFPEAKREVRIRMIYSETPKPAVWIFVTPV